MNESIRNLVLEDYLNLWNFGKELERRGQINAGFFWPPELLVAELQTHRGLGLFFDGELRAFILYRTMGEVWEVISLVTHPDFRGMGYMKRLLTTLRAQMPPPYEMWLEVHESNASAWNLYKKMGFKEVGRRPKYYKDGGTAIVLSWGPENPA